MTGLSSRNIVHGVMISTTELIKTVYLICNKSHHNKFQQTFFEIPTGVKKNADLSVETNRYL